MYVLLSDSAVELTTAELEKCSNFIARIDVKKMKGLKHTSVPAPEVGRMIGYVYICARNSVTALQNIANFAG